MTRTISGRLRNFLKFNGTSTYFTLPIIPSVSGFSFAFWMIKQTVTANNRIIDWQVGGPSDGFTITDHTNGIIELVFQNGGSVTADLASKPIDPGTLHHVAGTFDGTVSKLYIDDVLVSTDTSTVMSVAATTLSIGKRATGSSNYFKGKMAEFVFHNNICWTQAQIDALYYSGTIPTGASYYLFAGNVNDSSSNIQHGTASNDIYMTISSGRVALRPTSTALNFIPTSSVVTINDVAALRPETTQTFTWEAWIKPFNLGNNVLPRIMDKASAYMCIMGDITNGMYGKLAVELAGQSGAKEFWGSTTIPENAWTKVKCVCVNGSVQLYVNDQPEIMTIIDDTYVAPMGSSVGSNLLIGNSVAGNRNFSGLIANVLWSGVGKWDISEGVGTSVLDSFSTNNGTITNAVWASGI